MNSEKHIGLDVHQATIVVAVFDSTGKLVMEGGGGGGGGLFFCFLRACAELCR